nr:MAG TPA: hypothetical protein [Caudoviricetes sp.]
MIHSHKRSVESWREITKIMEVYLGILVQKEIKGNGMMVRLRTNRSLNQESRV